MGCEGELPLGATAVEELVEFDVGVLGETMLMIQPRAIKARTVIPVILSTRQMPRRRLQLRR